MNHYSCLVFRYVNVPWVDQNTMLNVMDLQGSNSPHRARPKGTDCLFHSGRILHRNLTLRGKTNAVRRIENRKVQNIGMGLQASPLPCLKPIGIYGQWKRDHCGVHLVLVEGDDTTLNLTETTLF